MSLRPLALAVVAGATLGGAALRAQAAPAIAPAEPSQPIVAPRLSNPAKVELGRKLFFDPRRSRARMPTG